MARRNDSRPAATRTVAYLRVSTDKQADHGVSLDAQRAKVEAYASLYDLELVAVEVDAGASAKSLSGRPALSRALSMLEAGEADALLVVKLDRLTRSVRDLGELVDRFQAGGWALLSVSEQVDTRTAGGRLVLNVLASVSQWEREAIGERTSAALAHKRANGEKTGGAVPFGSRLAADGIHLEPEPSEQEALELIKALRADGVSLRAIAAHLNQAGVPARGKRWHATTVARIVKREAA